MKCSFEIPTAHVIALKEHQEYDFVLAHMWMTDPVYRQSYLRGMVMDNGAYELGQPMELKDLMRVCKAARPTVMIAPDWIDNADRTMKAYNAASAALDCEVAGVVVGNIDEQLDCLDYYLHHAVEIICVPFRLDRLAFLQEATKRGLLSGDRWYHFLGLKSMDELREIKRFGLPNTSVDTSKPIKAAIHSKTIHDDLRGLGKLDMSATYGPETVERMAFQMDRFREIAQE